MQNKPISIGKAAKLLGVSIDTLRRWDLAGRLPSIRGGSRGHRYYRQSDIDQYLQNNPAIAQKWVEDVQAVEPKPEVYCPTRDVFQARLEHFSVRIGL
ncbi:MAG: helix-turn-helix domain-containing protein [Patescibacteria group bacterium]